MGSQRIEAVTADSSVPEILQAKGRTIRVNYIRRDGMYEVIIPIRLAIMQLLQIWGMPDPQLYAGVGTACLGRCQV